VWGVGGGDAKHAPLNEPHQPRDVGVLEAALTWPPMALSFLTTNHS